MLNLSSKPFTIESSLGFKKFPAFSVALVINFDFLDACCGVLPVMSCLILSPETPDLKIDLTAFPLFIAFPINPVLFIDFLIYFF